MTAARPAALRERGKNLFALIEALHETERQIGALRADIPDTPLVGQQRAFLFRRAKRQRRRSDIATQAAILEALPAHIAVIDAAGFIVAVNDAWRSYDRADTECGPGHAVGVNYLDVCDRAAGESVAGRRVAKGLRSVLEAAQSGFSTEYSCHLPAMERWLALTVVPIRAGYPSGAVVMHVDVTATHVIADSLLASATRFRQMAESIDDVFFLRDAATGRMVYVSPAYETIWARSCASLYNDPASWMEAIHPDDRADATAKFDQAGLTGRFAAEFRIVRPGGSIRWINAKGFPVRDDSGTIVRIAGIVEDITERKQALVDQRESEAQYRTLIETSFDAINVTQDGIILEVNAEFERMFGYASAEIVGRPATLYCAPESFDAMRAQMSNDASGTYDLVGLRKDGRKIFLDATARRHTIGGRPARITALRDMTERRQLEEQFRQAQKMDAVGRLAAGIAHDFNNQLSIIIAYAAFVDEDVGENDALRSDIAEIQKAAAGAAALTRQLLVFSRQQVIAPRMVYLDAMVDDSDKMLRRLIGEDISLVTVHGTESATALIDPGHVEQVIMNLVINARDAMPTGGALTIETRVVDLDESDVRAEWPAVPGRFAGRFAMLAVSDTGVGMDKETRDKIFEPFFTTKGTGTGLGLATVYGIVKQCGGSIRVESEPGLGSRFTIYLPTAPPDSPLHETVPAHPEVLNGTESILLAEDNASVRLAVREMLERFGYRVHEAPTGALALEFAEGLEEIDLLLADVVMPEMSGRILAERFGARRPGVRVLYMSGYTDDAVLRHGVSSSAVAYIEKPFSPGDLGRKVREVLDAR